MRRNRLAATLAMSLLVFATLFAAGEGCSSTDSHPNPGSGGIDYEGGSKDASKDTNPPVFEGGPGLDGDTEAGNNGCHDMFKDNQETDVDCGGSVCQKCVDGQSCLVAGDCAGGSCIGMVCKTASCANGVLDGDETDVDCGGATCPHCTIGKHCKAGTDCRSATCNASMACDCPTNMTIVSKATGGAYCIDASEVSKGEYNKFVTANVPVSTQPDICKSNTTFVPRGAWPPATAEDPGPAFSGISFSYSLAVHYVDWCDAYSYCKWAGKQLCGEINKQGLDPTQRNDAGASAWYNACSAQGAKTWPFGTIFDPTLCNNDGVGEIGTNGSGCNMYPDAGGTTNGCNCPAPATPYGSQGCGFGAPGVYQDDGVYVVTKADTSGNTTGFAHATCQGGSTGLYQMSGNVAEWEDSCTDGGPEAGASQSCGLRGGSYRANGDMTALSCAAAREELRMPPTGTPDPLVDIGIRCCVY